MRRGLAAAVDNSRVASLVKVVRVRLVDGVGMDPYFSVGASHRISAGITFFELPKSGKHQEEPFTEPTLVLRFVGDSAEAKNVHEPLTKRFQSRGKLSMPEKSGL